jgi:putative transposase
VPFRRPPRLRSFPYTGKHAYFVTCGVFERRRVFTDEASVKCVRAQVVRTCDEKNFEEIASVYMPDHVHLLVKGINDRAKFIPFMKLMRQRSAMHYRRLKNEFLWQDGYFDRVLRDDDDLSTIVQYMKDNPIRSKLVANADDYPFFFQRQKSAQL